MKINLHSFTYFLHEPNSVPLTPGTPLVPSLHGLLSTRTQLGPKGGYLFA